MTLLTALLAVIVGTSWLASLLLTGFSSIAVAAGLLVCLYVLNVGDRPLS